ncbi:MAG TPA: SIS domain-containing protein [Actinopolymorphaceae bacterium]
MEQAEQMTQMAAEIAEQPQAVARTLDALRPVRAELARLTADTRQVLFVARGSSDNACVYARYLVETHAYKMAGLFSPSVATQYRAEIDLAGTTVVCVSQSGETKEIVETMTWAASRGARTVAVTNNADSSLADTADLALVTLAGEERAVPATKTYTTQLAAMTILASALAPDPTALDADLARVPAEMARLIERRQGVDRAAELLSGTTEVLVSGRGLLFGTALEVALKLEETCLRPVRGLSYADLKHGPIAVVDDEMVTVVVAPQDGPVLGGLTEMASDLRRRGAVTIGIGGDTEFQRICTHAVPGPDLPESVAPLAAVVPGQLVVETLARRLGLDPDAPRGLSKVTQTDRH